MWGSQVRIVFGLAVLAGLLTGPRAGLGDVFHLKSGAVVEGKLLEKTEDHYRVRTLVGEVDIAIKTVERIEKAASVFDEYAQRVATLEETAAAHTELAKWCGEQELRRERREHLLRALELDADYAPARRGLGHVRIGDMWVDGRRVLERPETEDGEPEDEFENEQRILRAIRGQWRRRIGAIQRALLHSSIERLRADGREQILAIRDPHALLPLAEVLSRGRVSDRLLLIETLSGFDEQEASVTLAIAALMDRSERVREAAVGELVQRGDPHAVAQLREALRSSHDDVIKHAAYALGELKVGAAIPDLVQMLTTRRKKWVEVPEYRHNPDWNWWTFFGSPATPAATGMQVRAIRSGNSVEVYPGVWMMVRGEGKVAGEAGKIARYSPAVRAWHRLGVDVETSWHLRTVTVYRTEVMEALKKITGKNFGFEAEEWWRWYEENR